MDEINNFSETIYKVDLNSSLNKNILSEENIFVNEPMKNHITFKVGGPADFLVTPTTKEELIECLKLDGPKFILGNGSNLIVKDGGIN